MLAAMLTNHKWCGLWRHVSLDIWKNILSEKKNQMKNLNINETKKLINKYCQYFQFKTKNIKISLTLTLILK